MEIDSIRACAIAFKSNPFWYYRRITPYRKHGDKRFPVLITYLGGYGNNISLCQGFNKCFPGTSAEKNASIFRDGHISWSFSRSFDTELAYWSGVKEIIIKRNSCNFSAISFILRLVCWFPTLPGIKGYCIIGSGVTGIIDAFNVYAPKRCRPVSAIDSTFCEVKQGYARVAWRIYNKLVSLWTCAVNFSIYDRGVCCHSRTHAPVGISFSHVKEITVNTGNRSNPIPGYAFTHFRCFLQSVGRRAPRCPKWYAFWVSVNGDIVHINWLWSAEMQLCSCHAGSNFCMIDGVES